MVMERDSKKFKVYDTKTGQCKIPKTLPGGGETVVKPQGGAVIAADYIEFENQKYVVTTSNNNTLYFYDPLTDYRLVNTINTSEIQMCIRWCGAPINMLFTGGLDHIVHAWDVKQFIEITMEKDEIDKNDEQEIKHTDFIMDILPIVSHNRLATASLDKTICLWDLRKLKPLKLLKDH